MVRTKANEAKFEVDLLIIIREFSEYFRVPISNESLKVYVEILKGFSIDEIRDAFLSWSKTNSKMPWASDLISEMKPKTPEWY